MLDQLSCPNCRADILAKDINIDKLVAKCNKCHHVFSFEEEIQQAQRHRPEVLLPPGIEAYSTPNEVDMIISWRHSNSSFMTFFTILWNGMLLPFVFAALASGDFRVFLGISIHLAIGLGLLYNMIANFINTTQVNVDRQRLLIEHQPLHFPFYKEHHIPITDIQQIFIKKYVASKTNGTPNFAFSVNVELDSKRSIQLVRGLKHADQALYLEQQVERFLEIEDRPVEEEWLG